ncbi:MAG: hypothetical protein WBF79_12025 [Rhodococcus sp. (in: high G+C Gram-positive bacteria)]
MLSALALVPSTPLLSEQLAGSAVRELEDLRTAVRLAGDNLRHVSDWWIAIGAASTTGTVGPDAAGTYAGFGVDVVVGLCSESAAEPDRGMALSALTVGLVRGHCAADLSVTVHLVRFDADPDECLKIAATLRDIIDGHSDRVGLLVVGDGATTLTDKAPGAFDARAEAVQNTIDDAMATGDTGALLGLDPVLCREVGAAGRAAWHVAASVVGDAPVIARSLYRGAPYGVGYNVAVWEL